MSYTSQWVETGGVGGASQRATLLDGQGRTVGSYILERAPSPVTVQFSGLQPGRYVLHAELFSQSSLGGVLTGVLDQVADIGSSMTLRSSVGVDPTTIVVQPSAIQLLDKHSAKLYASAVGTGSAWTFVTPGSLTWQVFGSIGTINSDGILLGTAPGTGSVRATHTPTGIFGGASVQVQPYTPTVAKWTVLVYMNAANDLYLFSDRNMNQMEQVAGNPDVRFVVQWKQSTAKFPNSSFNGTRRYLVRPDTTNSIASELIQDMGSGVDMGRPATLNEFIQWGKAVYPAQRYVLVVWNHGNGWRRAPEGGPQSQAVSYDDETGNAIQIWELATALAGQTFDIIAWDCSLMQMMEVAYEVRNFAPYVAGSEESPPGAGYPYHLIFSAFRDHPDDSTLNLSKAFVDGMLAEPSYNIFKITQSVVDTSKLPTLVTKIAALANELKANQRTIGAGVQQIRAQGKAYSPTANRFFYDLSDVCRLIPTLINIPSLNAAAQDVQTAIPLAVVWEGHNSNSAASRGVSIDFSPADRFAASAADYAKMAFAAASGWDTWLAVAP